MKRLEWKEDCVYFNLGGCPDRKYPSYPLEYGERCEFHKVFFSGSVGFIYPDCEACSVYESR